MTARDWTPVLRGDTYCSPACGMGCKKSAYDEAHRKALDLHNRMTGKAWSIRVWENLGWHYELVREDKSSGFRCDIAERGDQYVVYFNSRPQIVAKGDDPNVVVSEAVQEAKRIANDILKHVALFPEVKP